MNQRGFGFIEIVIVVAVVAVAGFLIMQYFTSTAKTPREAPARSCRSRGRGWRPTRATLASVQGLVRNYQAEKGQWPPDKATVLALLVSAPKFQCPGNDFEYEPTSGAPQPHDHRRLPLLTPAGAIGRARARLGRGSPRD